MTFFQAFYLVFQTITTLGYGDIFPTSSSSRTLMILLVIFVVIVICDQTIKYMEIYFRIRKNNFEYQGSNHILILGSPRDTSLLKIVNDILKDKKENLYSDILIVRDLSPSPEILGLLKNSYNDRRVYYLQCSIFQEASLRKANIERAKSIIMLSEEVYDNIEAKKSFYSLCNFICELFPLKYKAIVDNYSSPVMIRHFDERILRRRTVLINTVILKAALIASTIKSKGISVVFQNFFTQNKNYIKQSSLREIEW